MESEKSLLNSIAACFVDSGSERARFAQLGLVNGAVGVVVAPRGRLSVVVGLTVRRGKIVEIDVIADPDRLRHLDLGVLDG